MRNELRDKYDVRREICILPVSEIYHPGQ